MSDRTLIEWSDATWNIITGCTRVSRGCGTAKEGGCYAEWLAATRLKHHPSRKGLTRKSRWTGEVRFNEQWLGQPLRWKKPRRIFVCAHSDLFHEAVPTEWIDKVFAVMAFASQHSFQVLTKRPERMREYLSDRLMASRAESIVDGWILERKNSPRRFTKQERWDAFRRADGWAPLRTWPLSNVWLGTSVEDQEAADGRIRELLDTPAVIRWISAEPLLGPIDLRCLAPPRGAPTRVNALAGTHHYAGGSRNGFAALDWVVCGGESGPRARPMDPQWARSLRDQCVLNEVPFFFKQWGGLNKKRAGRLLDGREWDQMPRKEARR